MKRFNRILRYFFHRQSNPFLYTILVVILGATMPVFADSTLAISPDSIPLEPGESQTFSATGYTGVLRWMAVKGNLSVARRAVRAWPGVTMDEAGQLEPLEGASVVYTAPEKWGTYSLAVIDEQAMAVAEIQVFDPDEAIVTIEILGGNRVLRIGDRRALSLQAWLADLSQRDYTLRADWKSSHPSIVTVNHEGVLTAWAAGTASLFAQVGEHSAQIEITVQEDTAIGLVLQPSPVRLMSGREQTLIIAQILQGSRQQAVEPTECDLKSDAQATIVRINERAEIQALSPGQAMIEVVCGGLEARVPVFVSSQLALQVSPEKLILGREVSKPFKISWGMPPYDVTAETGEVTGQDALWHYKARQVGNDRVTIRDLEGEETIMTVLVTKELVLSPLAVDLSVNQSTPFTASGGKPPYTWQATAGFPKPIETLEDIEVTYTAPNVNGVHELTVIDQQGYVKTAVINVNAGLMVTPRRLIMNPDEKKRFQVTGGTAPYKLSAKVGQIEEAEVGRYGYQAPDVSGDYTINVRDAEGRMRMIAVVVQSALQVTPSELFLQREEKAELNISGGYGDYTLTAIKGEIAKKGGKIRYQAPKVTGRDVITITDQAGAVVQVEVLVSTDSFYISPNEHYVLPEEQLSLRGWGGRPPYTWSGDMPLPITETQQGERIQLTAPKEAGEYGISIEESSGLKTESRVVVYQEALQLAPEKLVLAPGEQAELQALLGVPQYTWAVQQGQLSASEGKKVMYTAPSLGSEDVIQLQDATGDVKILRAVITMKTVRDISDLYVGSDGKVDEADANKAITDYFQKANWINRGELYFVVKRFLEEEQSAP